MPIYEYHCDDCGKDFEFVQKMSEAPKKSCPECGGRKFKKLVSSTAFQLKGTGWYATDYKNRGKEKGAKAKDDSKESQGPKKEDKKDDKKGATPSGESSNQSSKT